MESLTDTTRQDQRKVAVLISGRGSNLASLIQSQSVYRISAVLTNKAQARGIEHAIQNGIPYQTFDRSEYSSLKAQKAAIYRAIRDLQPDIVALAGYMQIVEPGFVKEFRGRLVNIHPSLLPDFPGLDTHKRVLAEGGRKHGATVHFVDIEVDSGPTIAQAECMVDSNDTEESLQAKVLKLEHKLYPWCIEQISLGNIRYNNGKVECDENIKIPDGFMLPPKS